MKSDRKRKESRNKCTLSFFFILTDFVEDIFWEYTPSHIRGKLEHACITGNLEPGNEGNIELSLILYLNFPEVNLMLRSWLDGRFPSGGGIKVVQLFSGS
jgi:hypothetical protein